MFLKSYNLNCLSVCINSQKSKTTDRKILFLTYQLQIEGLHRVTKLLEVTQQKSRSGCRKMESLKNDYCMINC